MVFHIVGSEMPVVICRGQTVHRNPTNQQVADCLGFNESIDQTQLRDLVIIGAGPSGLAERNDTVSSTTGMARYPLCRAQNEDRQDAKRHTIAEFLGFLRGLVQRPRWAKKIRIVLDNLSAHKTKAVDEFLQENPKVRFHFTPTYSSCLNQVELWFAKIQRDVIARGVFTSVADLARKLRKYIRAYANFVEPFRWTYTDPKRRFRTYEITRTAR